MLRILCAVIGFLLLVATGCFSLMGTKTPPEPPPTPPQETFEDGFRRVSGRIEAGTPVLNKIPYLHRLFLNTSYSIYDYIWDDPQGIPFFNTAAVVSPDGKYLLVGKKGGGAVSFFNLLDPTDHQFFLVPSRNDGKFQNLEVRDHDGYSFEYDASKPEGSEVAWLRFTPDASAFLVYRIFWQSDAPNLETMELFDRATGQLLRSFPIEPKFQAGAISPDGRLLLAAGPSALEYWDLKNGQKVGSVSLYGIGELTDIRCTPDGRFALLVPQTGNIRVYDFRSMTEVASLPSGNTQNLIDISPDGRVLVVLVPTQRADTGTPRKKMPNVVASYRIQHYEIGTWTLLSESKVIPSDEETMYGFFNVRFSQDGNRLVASGESRIEKKKNNDDKEITRIEIWFGLFEYDLSSSYGKWRPIDKVKVSLPLHPDGKYLLDGRPGSARLTGFTERLGQTVSMPDAHL